jgi:hypothetical protein
MENIFLFERDLVTCPNCMGNTFLVTQKLSRSSDVIKIDGLCDICCKPFDENNYDESLVLTCKSCSSSFQPQSGVACVEDGRVDSISAYDETAIEEIQWPSRAQNTKEL